MKQQNIPIHGPQLQVTLFKTVQRTTINGTESVSARYSTVLSRSIDLTPFLTELSTINTSKSIRDAAGGFSITVSDQPYSSGSGSDSLYGVVEPMDMVEIRFRHIGNGGSQLPVIMRGFVSDVSRSESIGQDGIPARGVTISGQDYGKLWQMIQIFYGPAYVIGQDILSAFHMFERFGVGFKIGQSGAEFLAECFQKIFNPYLQTIVYGHSSNPIAINLIAQQNNGTTSLSGTQNQEGTLYDIFRTFLDVGAWNEMFITEDDSNVYCIYRPNPALDINGKFIDPIDASVVAPTLFDINAIDVTKVVYHIVSESDIVSMNVSRSDSNVSNYYWVRAPRYELVDNIVLRQAAITSSDKATVDLGKYVNTQAALYGIRKMEMATEMGDDAISNTSSGLPAAEQSARGNKMMSWIAKKRLSMVNQNKDNVILEHGSIVIKGNEHIRAGNYVKIVRGTFSSMYYVVQVDHQYSPFNRFISILQVERGTGFIERMRKNGGSESPYYAEMA